MALLLSIALGTLISEDLTSVATGLLIQQRQVDPVAGVFACTLGIFTGDFGLWALGRVLGDHVLSWAWLARRLPAERFRALRAWLERHAGAALLGSRFLPGTRLPLYVLSGIVKVRAQVFVKWTLIAAVLWTPAIVLGTAAIGGAVALRSIRGVVLAGLMAIVLLQTLRAISTASGRRRISARLQRWSRWEFWPSWLFYAPVGMWIAYLAVKHRGLSTITAANPGMTDGGTVGESKHEILVRLPLEWTIPSMLVRPANTLSRVRTVVNAMADGKWAFPLVLKPDVGQRGLGVKLASSVQDIEAYLIKGTGPVLVQPYHDGPFEAGIFYYRMPGWPRGRILSITDKHFPFVVGDGRSTVADLIWSHPRYRMQTRTFFERHREALDRVPADGERVQLAVAGNHAQGTVFRDGRHLLTPALEARIDAIAQSFGGFFVGRFDIRYRDVEAFKAGLDVAIVELNGATAESTDIYDPDGSLLAAYRQLFRQWSIVFRIGAANRASGAPVSSCRRLLALVGAHLASPTPFPVSD